MVERNLQERKEYKIYEQMECLGLRLHWFRNGDYEIPTSYNLEGFNRRDKTIIKRSLNSLIDFLRTPSLEDWFDKHHERVLWYGKLDVSKSFDRLLSKNRLRANEWGLALFHLDEMIEVLLVKNDERGYKISTELKYFRKLVKGEGDGKTSLDFVEKISECAYKTLWMFGRKETSNAPQDRI